MSDLIVRPATTDDLTGINEVYNPYVSYCSSAIQDEPDTLDARRAWFDRHDERHPILVADLNGKILGFAALSVFDDRPGFDGTVRDTLFVRDSARGRGVGGALMKEMLARAKAIGHRCIIAAIDSHQIGLLQAHMHAGFHQIATFRGVAMKFGRPLDIVYLQLKL
jgi:phosphinothricin acetyltransferase